MTLISSVKDVYRERNLLVLLAARLAADVGFPVWLGRHDPSDPRDASHGQPGWEEYMRFIAITLPTGQMTWTLHDSEVELFERFEVAPELPHAASVLWDGHTTEEKYERLKAWALR